MMFWWLLPLALVIALVIYFANPSAGKSATEKTAMDILKERYARGEIGKDEFDVKKRDLST
jgi:putative membrane protein